MASAFYLRNRDACLKEMALYREKHREELSQKAKDKYRANLEENRRVSREKRREYYYAHREEELLKQRLNAYNRRKYWAARYLRCGKERNAKQRLMRSSLTQELVVEVYARNRQRNNGVLVCYLCYKPIEEGQDNLEHKIPLSRGGKNELSNLDVAHWFCNLTKGTMTLEEYSRLVPREIEEERHAYIHKQ